MKYVEPVKDIRSSVLGFGCAPILGSKSAIEAQIALDCAIDNGINHFDLARSYGYGEAEKFVGRILKGRRNNVVIASKFGITANWKASVFKPLKPLIRMMRPVKKAEPSSQEKNGNSNRLSNLLHDTLHIDAKTMKRSLEMSLKAIGTDRLDYFFIHEPKHTIIEIDEVLELSEQLKKEGKIRAFGIAYLRSQESLHSAYLDKFDILQFDNSPGAYSYQSVIEKRGHLPNILFSPLSGGDKNLQASDKLLTLHKDFPKSVILCSMFNKKHINQNANLFSSE